MNKRTNMVVASVALLCSAAAGFAQDSPPAAPPARTHTWWRDQAPGAGRGYTVNNKKMPLISVNGNKFVDPDGKTVLFRGLAISDPD